MAKALGSLHCLPVEIRLRIYNEVVSCDGPLTPATKDEQDKLDLAILTTSKKIYREAIDAFYEVNLIRFHEPEQMQAKAASKTARFLRRARRFEFYNPHYNGRFSYDAASILKATLPSFIHLPKFKGFTIACDNLGREGYTVREWTEKLGLSDNLRCIDIGLYTLGGELAIIFIRHFKLSERWAAEVETMPADYDVIKELEAANEMDGMSVGATVDSAAEDSLRA